MKAVSLEVAASTLGVKPSDIYTWEKKQLIRSYPDNSNKNRVFDLEEINAFYQRKYGTTFQNSYKILKAPTPTTITAIELFAGAGGLALGFENAGIQHQLLVESDRACLETLKKKSSPVANCGGRCGNS